MSASSDKSEKLIRDLQERSKELNCLYQVEEILKKPDIELDAMFNSIIGILPAGWQYPEFCQVKIQYQGKVFLSPDYQQPRWEQNSEIRIHDDPEGLITVSYKTGIPEPEGSPFLKEEQKLLVSISERIAQHILNRDLKKIFDNWKNVENESNRVKHNEWKIILNMLKKSDKNLYIYLSQRMMQHLCWNGVEEAKKLMENVDMAEGDTSGYSILETNRPSQRKSIGTIMEAAERAFKIAQQHLEGDIIFASIQKWIDEEKSRSMTKIIGDPYSTIPSVIDAITRINFIDSIEPPLKLPNEKGLRVSLIRHFLSDQLEFINVAKNFITIENFFTIVPKIIYPTNSHGKLGGKSSGMILAHQILKNTAGKPDRFEDIKMPNSWFIASDAMMNFIYYNNLEGIIEQKYKNIDEIQAEYGNIVQLFKNSHFPPEIVRGLSLALDEFGNIPIIVRSSSLLEDQQGKAFSGKYKSLFLANRGTKQERLDALMDAIAEVYASMFSPDPIQYREEYGLLDFYEEMGIIIQEVVGKQVGHYFFPAFAGVAFSSNEFRWSPRIEKNDGLVRMVPGLGTRAVDRIAEDYPILLAPGKPHLRANVTPDEIVRYSTKKIDVINLEKNSFETISFMDLLKEYGHEIEGIQHILSEYDGQMMHVPTSRLGMDFEHQKYVVTFEGIFKNTDFVKQIEGLLRILHQKTGGPVDIEFAHDGTNLYLLQCRPQSFGPEFQPSPIPQDIPDDRVLFSASRYVTNGFLGNITHIVYVDPEAYSRLSDLEELKAVGKAVGRLNKILPKRQFILMGPGRWGSRGDIKLGVNVTYSDINRTAMLIEIALRKGDYIPELSFGTHFFQDLVEASIRYLPLYPDESENIFNQVFLTKSKNILRDLAPEFSDLSDIVYVTDVPGCSEGKILNVAMNADLNRAMGFLAEKSEMDIEIFNTEDIRIPKSQAFWKWRYHMAEEMASRLDPEQFGVASMYIFGSTKNGTAGPGSDIDLLVHFRGTETQKKELNLWFEGWSRALAEMNYLRTGYRTDELLDIHYITDNDIQKKTSYAMKISAVTDAAVKLEIKNNPDG